MAARTRATLSLQLFDLHPIRTGIEAGAYSRMKAALEAAKGTNEQHVNREDSRRLLREGRRLLGWLSQPADRNRSDEVLVSAVSRMLKLRNLTLGMKAELIRVAPGRSRGRPSDMKLRAVYALEARLARPEATWEQITACVCPCVKRGGHDEHCVENLESAVKRLKAVLRKMDLISFIIEITKHRTLKHNLKEMFDQNG